jgi:hypothetical protein
MSDSEDFSGGESDEGSHGSGFHGSEVIIIKHSLGI